MARRFRVTANFPILAGDSHQTTIVEGSNWQVALGKAARKFKLLPVMHRRRVTSFSMMVEQIGSGDQSEVPLLDQQPVSEQNVMEQADSLEHADTLVEGSTGQDIAEAGELLNQQADNEAERLIVEGEEIEDDN